MMKIYLIFTFIFAASNLFSKKIDVEILFNAATEKYLQGDYHSAVKNLEEALKIEPKNERIIKFLTRILTEAGEHYNLLRDYHTAFFFLKKAIKIAPNDKKINRLYMITKDIIEPKKEELQPLKIKKKPKKEKLKPPKLTKAKPAKKEIEEKPKKAKKPKKKKIKAYIPKKIKPSPIKRIEPPKKIKTKKVVPLYLKISQILSLLIISALLIKIIKLSKKTKKQQNLILKMQQEHEKIQSEKESLQKKLKEGEEIQKLAKGIEEIKLQLTEKVKQSKFLSKQKQSLRSMLFEISEMEGKIYMSSPEIEERKERIANIAENIYAYSPKSAIKFFRDIINDRNPLTKIYIVKALAKIAKPETLNMLFELYRDNTNYKLKRETIKELKTLKERVETKKIDLPKEYENKIITALKEIIDDWVV